MVDWTPKLFKPKEIVYIQELDMFAEVVAVEELFQRISFGTVPAGNSVEKTINEMNPPANQAYAIFHIIPNEANTRIYVEQPKGSPKFSTSTTKGFIDDKISTFDKPITVNVFIVNNRPITVKVENLGTADEEKNVYFIGQKLKLAPTTREKAIEKGYRVVSVGSIA